ncbi:MAG: putative fructose-bisphosphate aldolase [Syntrophaceae bacterium PtaB.Bin095]|nr:MAG: putative fructose-bisphosphate aldolase [Syntrophaceae bacterium PtaB.Bin095]
MRPMKELLDEAQKKGYAVGAFNVYNFETLLGVVKAAQEEKAPVIIAFGERYLENMDFESVALVAERLSREVSTPIALHLDHCKAVGPIVRAIRAGFTSVMFDGSSLPFAQNVAATKDVVRIAHAAGVSVEAELGAIALGDRSNEEGAEQIYTDPAQARELVESSGVDALAVSIGTVHGLYRGEPKIDIDTLKAIRGLVSVPLVLHGGSGTPEGVLRECIRNGVCKINVNTEISTFVVDRFRALLASGKDLPYSKLSLEAVSLVTQVVRKYIGIFKG